MNTLWLLPRIKLDSFFFRSTSPHWGTVDVEIKEPYVENSILFCRPTLETVVATANTGKHSGKVLETMQVNGPGG